MATVRTIDICEAGPAASAYSDDSFTDTTVVLKDGVPVALVVPVNGIDPYLETYLTTPTPAFQEILGRARASAHEGKSISIEELRKELGLDDNVPARKSGQARKQSA